MPKGKQKGRVKIKKEGGETFKRKKRRQGKIHVARSHSKLGGEKTVKIKGHATRRIEPALTAPIYCPIISKEIGVMMEREERGALPVKEINNEGKRKTK